MANQSSAGDNNDDIDNRVGTDQTEPTNKIWSYEDKISALPKVKGCFSVGLWSYQGGYYWCFSLPGLMRMQDLFRARSGDIIIASFPKSGTTWLKALVFAITNRTRYETETHPLLSKTSHQLIPSLEMDLYADPGPSSLDGLSVPRLLSTHVHYASLSNCVANSACKIVYICRDPKDVFVSFWHFVSKIIPQGPLMEEANISLSDKLTHDYNLFCEGLCPNGPYWDHVLSYWKASIENPGKILFLKYEDIKREPQLYVKKLAEFIDEPFSLTEEENGKVQQIVDMCSFEFLSNLQVSKSGIFLGELKNDAFYRNGEVGDWKNHLTLEMAQRLDEITKQKLHGYGLTL